MLVLTILVFITLALKGGMYVYYFKYYLDGADLASFLQGIGFNGFIAALNSTLTGMGLTEFQWPSDAPTSAFSLFSAAGIFCGIVGICLSKSLADRFGKRDVFGGALFVSTLWLLAFALFSPQSVGWVIVAGMLHGFFYGITTPLLWSMVRDVATTPSGRTTAAPRPSCSRPSSADSRSGSPSAARWCRHTRGRRLRSGPRRAEPRRRAQHPARGERLCPRFLPALCGVAVLYEIDRKTESRIEHELAARRGT